MRSEPADSGVNGDGATGDVSEAYSAVGVHNELSESVSNSRDVGENGEWSTLIDMILRCDVCCGERESGGAGLGGETVSGMLEGKGCKATSKHVEWQK
jgi:hypothetical protein